MNPMHSRLIDNNGQYTDPTSKKAIKKIQNGNFNYRVSVENDKKVSFEFTVVDKKGHRTGVIRYY